MPSLLDLTVQGDVATISDESKLPQVKLMTPLELYRLWERQHWASHQIDLETDRRDWASLSEYEREQMLYGLSAFFVGEERVTNQFSGLVLAAEDKHEEAFLLTQQVDEARHGQHFQTLRLERRGILPGHLEAFKRIAQDEHRHVAYGTWYLQRKARDPELARRVQDKLAQTLPAAASVIVPPGMDPGDEVEFLGASPRQRSEFAYRALTRRLKVIGIGLSAVAV